MAKGSVLLMGWESLETLTFWYGTLHTRNITNYYKSPCLKNWSKLKKAELGWRKYGGYDACLVSGHLSLVFGTIYGHLSTARSGPKNQKHKIAMSL